VLFATLLVGLTAQASETAGTDSPRAWLEKMGKALKEENYEGIFTYMRGDQFDTVRVFHRYKDGKESERLVHLNGEKREIIRDGDKLICKHADADHVDLEHEIPMGPFTNAFNQNLSTYQDLYRLTLHGEDRIADRPAIKLGISPKHNDRYGYRLWLDKQTGLLLQSHLVNRGRVLEVFQFAEVKIGEPISNQELASSLPANAVSHELTPAIPQTASADVRPNWKAAWVPDGFKAVRLPQPDRLLFTDGLATISVFVEEGEPAELPEMTMHMGGTVVITKRVRDSARQITVVGEVPVNTARKVAESVERATY